MALTHHQLETLRLDIKGLCKMSKLLGYKDPCQQLMNDDGTVVGDFLYFLEDNPGVVEAIYNWVSENCEVAHVDDDKDSDEEDEEEED